MAFIRGKDIVAQKKKIMWFSYSKNMANFEVFLLGYLIKHKPLNSEERPNSDTPKLYGMCNVCFYLLLILYKKKCNIAFRFREQLLPTMY